MSKRVSFSNQEKSIDEIWNWYEYQKMALLLLKNTAIDSVFHNIGSLPKFAFFTSTEINEYFDESEKELEYLVCFNILSSMEALLKIDYLKKAYSKSKSNTGRDFRKIYKLKYFEASLIEDIVNTWKKHYPPDNKYWGDLIGAYNFRNWLAHGRYWDPKLGRQYRPDIILKISNDICRIIKAKK